MEVKGGTLNKLIERLTFPGGVEPTFLKAFLLTYRSFTTPTILLQLLRSRFAVPLPHNVTDAELALFHTCVVKPVRLRVINVTKHWLKFHRYDFDTDAALRDTCMQFVDEICATHVSYAAQAKTLRQHLISSRWRAASLLAMERRGDTGEEGEEGVSWPPRSSHPGGEDLPPLPLHLLSSIATECDGSITVPVRKPGSAPSGFLELPAVDVAFQLILHDCKLFRAIQPKECLRKAWSTPRLKRSATNVLALSAHFNAVAFWMIWEITYEPSLKERARVLLRFIEIAICCYEHRAYCCANEVISAVKGSAVHRLDETWREMRSMARKEDLKKWEELVSGLSFKSNYKAPLALLDNCEPPCVPYFGMFLTQLTKLEDGAPDTLTPPTSDERCGAPLINMSKLRRIASIIARIQTLQDDAYRFAAAPDVVSYLQSRVGPWETALFAESLSNPSRGPAECAIDKALYDASLICEPRAASGSGGISSPRRGSVMPGAEFLFSRNTPRSTASPEANTRRGSMP